MFFEGKYDILRGQLIEFERLYDACAPILRPK